MSFELVVCMLTRVLKEHKSPAVDVNGKNYLERQTNSGQSYA